MFIIFRFKFLFYDIFYVFLLFYFHCCCLLNYLYIFGLNVDNCVFIFPPNSSFINSNTFLFFPLGNRLLRGELHSNYIILYFVLICIEWDSTNIFTKMNFFFLPKLTFQHHFHKAYI